MMLCKPAVLSYFTLLISTIILLWSVARTEAARTCRYGSGHYMEPSVFKPYACCNCYGLLFRLPGGQEFGSGSCNYTTNRIEDLSQRPPVSLAPVPSNKGAICDLVGSEIKCQQWIDCCQGAIDCCDDMVREEEVTPTQPITYSIGGASTATPDPYCPTTWDTFKCWKRAIPNTNPSSLCPEFLTSKVMECVDPEVHYAERECLEDGSWNANLSVTLYESSYQRCTMPMNCHQVWVDAKHYLEITCEVLSLCAVIPALLIFVIYRNLRSQPRIRLHINLFIALALYDIIHLIYQLTVRQPDLVSSVMAKNPVECRVLTALTKFSVLSMFIWMLMEGFFLHWLMTNTFQQPRLLLFTIAGWSIPTVFTIAYAVAKVTSSSSNKGCWIMADNWDWIVNVLMILCLALNVIFLANIMRIIATKLAAMHHSEQNFYRRALKSAAILVPPFGLLLLFNLYSPDAETQYKAKLIVDCVGTVVKHLQGLFISLIFCYSNGEVKTNLRKTRNYYIPFLNDSSQRMNDASIMTAVSHLSTGRPSISLGADTSLLTTTPTPTQETKLLEKHLANGESNNNREESNSGD